jgi:WD40 repeat protein
MLAHLEYSPDGRLLATVCRDGSLQLWDAHTGQPLSPTRRQGMSCDAVRFSSDGRTFLVRDTTGFRFWDTEHCEPATIHFPGQFPGTARDCEAERSILSPGDSRIFVGYGMDRAALWEVENPVGRIPVWFPEFLETLALMKFDEQGASTVVSGSQIFRVKEQIAASDDAYARWAKRVLGLD